MVDEATRYQAAQWLQNITAKHTWDIVRLCWIDVYLGPPDYIHHDAGKNFVSREFCQLATSLGSTTKSVPIEAHWSIGLVERYHAVLRQAYKVIMEDLQGIINKKTALQIAVKVVNNTAGSNGLVPTLLVFGAYPRMHSMDPPTPTIIQRATVIEKAMEQVRKIRAESQVIDAINTRNGPLVDLVYDLPVNSDVLVWREDNAGRTGKWTGPFKLLGIEGKTCKIHLPSGPTEFQSTVVKPYLVDDDNTEKYSPSTADFLPLAQDLLPDNAPLPTTKTPSTPITRPSRVQRPPIRYQNITDVSTFSQEKDSLSPLTPTPFVESRQKEMNGLIEKGVFEVVSISEVPKNIKIFNSRFVDEIQNIGAANAFEKSRLVVQAYNDHDKMSILTQSPTIQRMSQRLILALSAINPQLGLYLRDITQAYVQSSTSINREFYIRPPIEFGFQNGTVMKVIKPLYGIPEAGAHWFNTYHTHHINKLSMMESTYDSCLLYTDGNDKGFGVVGLQTDDTLILANDIFAAAEEKELKEAKLLAKDREKLTSTPP